MDTLPEIGLLLAFGAGIISFFSPCVAPLVPGYLSFVSGVSTSTAPGGIPSQPSGRFRMALATLGPSLLFVLGFTLVFVVLGTGVALFGGLLEEYRQPMNRVTGVVMITMGLLLADVLRLPALSREWRLHFDSQAGTFASRSSGWTIRTLGPSAPLFLGMTFAFGWVPCVGPILAGILLYAGSTATVGTGAWLLFAYSLGLGVPFILSGVAAAWILSGARRVRRLWPWIARFSGGVLVVMGLLFVTDRFFYLSIAMQRLYYAFFY